MNQTTEQLESLILRNCSEMTFRYGSDTEIFGNSECRVAIKKMNSEASEYSGVVLTNHRLDDESRGLSFQVLLDNDDVIACGSIHSGGRFIFPYSKGAEGMNCRLEIKQAKTIRRAANIPVSLRRAIRPEFAGGGKAADQLSASGDRGAIRLVGPNIIVRVRAADLPFDILVVTASDKTNAIVGKCLIHLPENGNSHGDIRTAFLDASIVLGDLAADDCYIDAWGLTTAPETQSVVTDEMLARVASMSAKAANAVSCYRVISGQ